MTITQPIDLEFRMCLEGTAFPLADANGNGVTYVDAVGNIQAHYTYNAFGGTVSQSGDMDDAFRFRFSSKYLDDETGLYYYGYRYYDPATGRWLSRDPIGESGGLMLYGFANNNGVNLVDFLGLRDVNAMSCAEFKDYKMLASKLYLKYLSIKKESCGDAKKPEYNGIGGLAAGVGDLVIYEAMEYENYYYYVRQTPDIPGPYGQTWAKGQGYSNGLFKPRVATTIKALKVAGYAVSAYMIADYVAEAAKAAGEEEYWKASDNTGRALITGLGMTGVGAVAALPALIILEFEDYFIERHRVNQENEIRESECQRSKKMLKVIRGHLDDIDGRECPCP